MDVRRRTEEIEHLTFAPWATFSDASRGRVVPEPQDPLRPVFQRDRDRVLHCKAFRRLKQKTQVFLSPEGDLYRTRLTHTLEVSQIARTIARGLRLNEDLTEAISLAHDLGHTPFGHAGEKALNDLCPDGFHHYMQSLRVVDRLEKDGEGLNLTWEVRNGIVTHTKGTWAATPEGRIVRLADQIADNVKWVFFRKRMKNFRHLWIDAARMFPQPWEFLNAASVKNFHSFFLRKVWKSCRSNFSYGFPHKAAHLFKRHWLTVGSVAKKNLVPGRKHLFGCIP